METKNITKLLPMVAVATLFHIMVGRGKLSEGRLTALIPVAIFLAYKIRMKR